MPGPIVHLLVQQRLPAQLRRTESRDAFELARLLDKDPCSPYAAFGSMGPDFLFFSMKEYGSAIGDLANFIFDVYDAIEPLIEFYEQTVGPIKEAIDDAVSFLLPDDLEALFKQIGDTADLLGTALLTQVAKIATDQIDFFYFFYPKIQAGAPENEWYWFDFLHYRRTGQFASNLWRIAKEQGDEDLMRYALGYCTHVGTDVVGHPFVNAIVGGPYRNHWHRHKLVENWIDAWARRHYDDSSQTKNCLRIDPSEDVYRANSIGGSYYSRLCEFPGKKMPVKLQKLLVEAMHQTYDDIPHPVTFSGDDLDTTYRLWIKWFERATAVGDALPPPPVPPPGAAAGALVDGYVETITDIWSEGGGGSGGSGGGGFSIWGFFAAIADFLRKLFETIIKTVQYVIEHAAEILLLPLTEAIALVRYLLYQIQLGLWQMYDEARFALVLGGYLFPDERDFSRMPWAEAFLRPANAHMTGGPAAAFTNYPRKRQNYQHIGATELHLVYPSTLRERWRAEPCPTTMWNATPAFMIDGAGGPTAKALPFLDCEQPYGPVGDTSDDFTYNVQKNTWTTSQLGAALPFSAYLAAHHMDKLPDFNLDGDRGYAFLTWRLKGLDPLDPATDPARIEFNPVLVEYGPTV